MAETQEKEVHPVEVPAGGEFDLPPLLQYGKAHPQSVQPYFSPIFCFFFKSASSTRAGCGLTLGVTGQAACRVGGGHRWLAGPARPRPPEPRLPHPARSSRSRCTSASPAPFFVVRVYRAVARVARVSHQRWLTWRGRAGVRRRAIRAYGTGLRSASGAFRARSACRSTTPPGAACALGSVLLTTRYSLTHWHSTPPHE